LTLKNLQQTTSNKFAAVTRLLVAMIFLMTGPMKLLFPRLAEAWSSQLLAAEIPFYTLSRWSVPFLELFIGILLTVGIYVRPTAALAIVIMIVATYVHIVVDDPALFPLQPSEPIIPIVLIVMCLVLLRLGAGAWSMDGKASASSPQD
jgi:uncharacterized membrane protein YphA (DoxX/SURF4 family)